MRAGYIVLIALVVGVSVGGVYVYSEHTGQEGFGYGDNPESATEPSDGEQREKSGGGSMSPQERFETLEMSCEFHDEVPDVERDDINMRIEGRPLATHDGHLEGLMHENTNEIRESHGLNPVNCDPQLVMISRNHSEDMARRDFVGHTNPDGQDPFDRLDAAGYECPTGGSENIYQGWYGQRVDADTPSGYTVPETPEELARDAINSGLYQSPGHRRNMLREKWSVMGIGVYVTDENKVYVTQMFC